MSARLGRVLSLAGCGPLTMNMLGIPFVINGRAATIRGIALADGPGHLPIWTVSIEAVAGGSVGAAGSLENALLYAARSANSSAKEA